MSHMYLKKTTKIFVMNILLLSALLTSSMVRAEHSDLGSGKDVIDYHRLATLSSLAYEEAGVISDSLDANGLSLNAHSLIPIQNVAFFLAEDKTSKHQIIAVRGTANIENAIIDAAVTLKEHAGLGIPLHEGFSLAADSLFEKVKPLLQPGTPVSVTGHSMGGAVAMLLGLLLEREGITVHEVVTFGQPRITNYEGSKAFKGIKVTRFVTPLDLVPLVPPVDMTNINLDSIYWHYGEEILLLEGDEYAVLTATESMARSVSALGEKMDELRHQQHKMAFYLSSLESKLESNNKVSRKPGWLLMGAIEGLIASKE